MGKYKAFQGPNGWYIAFEGESGFHRQAQCGEYTMTRAKAIKRAAEKNEEMKAYLEGQGGRNRQKEET